MGLLIPMSQPLVAVGPEIPCQTLVVAERFWEFVVCVGKLASQKIEGEITISLVISGFIGQS